MKVFANYNHKHLKAIFELHDVQIFCGFFFELNNKPTIIDLEKELLELIASMVVEIAIEDVDQEIKIVPANI